MLRIAICDDDEKELHMITSLLSEYRMSRAINLHWNMFQNPLELLASIEQGTVYDIVFLDMMMPGLNGIETARELRTHDKIVKLIFLTSSTEFAVQSYAVNAYCYLLKPITTDDFFSIIDHATEEIHHTHSIDLMIRCKTGVVRIPIHQLVCCEVTGRMLTFRLSTGAVLESAGSMKDVEPVLLQYPGFTKPHRSYMINMDYIQNISYREITLVQQITVPLPRGKYNTLKDTFLEYAFQEGGYNEHD